MSSLVCYHTFVLGTKLTAIEKGDMQQQPESAQTPLTSLLRHDFIRFCVVGGLGFLINLFMLTLTFRMLRLPIILAQLISAEVAYVSNFFFHHTWTYAQRSDKTKRQLLVQFHLSSWTGLLLSTLIVYAMVEILRQNYVIGLVIASVVVLFWNYFWTKFYIWRNQHVHQAAVDPKAG